MLHCRLAKLANVPSCPGGGENEINIEYQEGGPLSLARRHLFNANRTLQVRILYLQPKK